MNTLQNYTFFKKLINAFYTADDFYFNLQFDEEIIYQIAKRYNKLNILVNYANYVEPNFKNIQFEDFFRYYYVVKVHIIKYLMYSRKSNHFIDELMNMEKLEFINNNNNFIIKVFTK